MGNPFAKYTMTYQEAVGVDPSIPLALSLDTEVHTAKFREMLMNHYWCWEIGGETIGEFKQMLTKKFYSLKDYYVELINAYETKIDMLDGKKSITTINEGTSGTEESSSTSHSSGSNESEGKNFDLPRTSATESKPSSKSEGTASSLSDGNSTYKSGKTGTRDSNVVFKGGESVITLKKEYMNLLRNVYMELIEDLKPCFLDLFW